MTRHNPTTAHQPLPATGQLALPLTVPEADAHLATRAATSADMLTGLITAGLLHTVGSPTKLPTALWPDADPVIVQAVWDVALSTGLWMGEQRAAGRQWRPEALDTARQELAEAGFTALAGQVAMTASHGRRPASEPGSGEHPADADLPPGDRPTTRGNHPAPR